MTDFQSPFATAQTETYKLDQEIVIGGLVYTADDKQTGVKAGDPVAANFAEMFEVPADVAESYWLRLRLPTSRSDNAALEQAGEPGTPEWRKTALLQLCEAWSIAPEVSGADYDRLQAWVYRWIDSCVLDAISRGVAGRAEKKSSSVTPRRSRGSSPRARP